MGILHSDRYEYTPPEIRYIACNYYGIRQDIDQGRGNWMWLVEEMVDYTRACRALWGRGHPHPKYDSKTIFEDKCQRIADFLNSGEIR